MGWLQWLIKKGAAELQQETPPTRSGAAALKRINSMVGINGRAWKTTGWYNKALLQISGKRHVLDCVQLCSPHYILKIIL